MKFTLKLLLLPCLVIAAIYAATPLWLPYVLNRQLPDGWQLEALDAGYPDLSGINLHSLQVKGGLQAADVSFSAIDVRFSYAGFKTRIKSITLDVLMGADKRTDIEAITLDDLSLPVMNLTGKMPELSVDQLRLALHSNTGQMTGKTDMTQPLVLHFEAFRLTPRSTSGFDVATLVTFEELPLASGRLELNLGKQHHIAKIQFPAAEGSNKWLVVSAEQNVGREQKTTRIQAVFDADAANREWLDSILSRGSGGFLKHANGTLEAQADFAGPIQQQIQQLSLATENLQLLTDGGTFGLETGLLVSREQGNTTARLSAPTVIQYQDETGRMDELLKEMFPEFQRAARAHVQSSLLLKPDSSFTIGPGHKPAIRFAGEFLFKLDSNGETLKLKSDEIRAEMAEFPRLDTVAADGRFMVDWEEKTTITYASDAGDLSADQLSISAEIVSRDGALHSNGQGSITRGNMINLSTSAKSIDLQWQALDLLNLSGSLATQTHGFSNTFEGETWSGFDFSLNYQLTDGERVKGSGEVLFDKGPGLPIKFNGNAKTQRWHITLALATIKMPQLVSLLNAAHLDFPSSIKLVDGTLMLQGSVEVEDEIVASLDIKGDQFAASMKESHAKNASFSFNTLSGQQTSANGPVSIELIELAGGFNISHLKAELEMENTNNFGLKDLRANLLDGQLFIDSLRFLNNSIEDARAELSHISLGQLLEFADIDGLQGSGFLDISLPVSHTPTGIAIMNGSFRATAPGRLAYTTGDISAGNIGLQALENFQYKDLSGTIDYQADGQYQIAVRLEGNNPGLYDGYPVVFNLNINGSLPELFEALFITGNFEEAILNEIRER
jgi:hypothetical protein